MRSVRVAFIVALVAFGGSSTAWGQRTDTASKQRPAAADARDSVFLRARKLLLDGNGAAGRALVDSALAAATIGTTEYATALYWHGALSSTAADAERDYRRVIVEYPFSPHSGDALLALAQLEMARGDRDPAIDHLQRFLLQHPNDPDRVRAGIWLGRLLLEQNQLAKGCAVLLRTRASLGDGAVELRNQVDYYASRCADVDTAAAPPRSATQPPAATRAAAQTPVPTKSPRADSAPPRRRAAPRDSVRTDTARRATRHRDSVRTDTARPAPRHRDSATIDTARRPSRKRDSATKDSGAPKRFTVQVAAYDTRQAAEELVARLSARGIAARVVPSSGAPHRVRVGHYATDAEATAAARDLKEKGIVGFVTTTDNESAPVRR